LLPAALNARRVADRYVFADEAGNFDFSRGPGASRYCWVDATILEKSKAQPHLRSEAHLYKMAWYLHFKYLARRIDASDRLFVAASSLGTKKARGALHAEDPKRVRCLAARRHQLLLETTVGPRKASFP
jgi:hypothetical protein